MTDCSTEKYYIYTIKSKQTSNNKKLELKRSRDQSPQQQVDSLLSKKARHP